MLPIIPPTQEGFVVLGLQLLFLGPAIVCDFATQTLPKPALLINSPSENPVWQALALAGHLPLAEPQKWSEHSKWPRQRSPTHCLVSPAFAPCFLSVLCGEILNTDFCDSRLQCQHSGDCSRGIAASLRPTQSAQGMTSQHDLQSVALPQTRHKTNLKSRELPISRGLKNLHKTVFKKTIRGLYNQGVKVFEASDHIRTTIHLPQILSV